jgi:hypothetical protein
MVKGEPESNALKYNGRYRRQIRNQLKIVSFSPSVFPRCALHLQRQDGWLRFVSMQDHYNLLARESDVATGRSERDPFANMHYKQKSSDRAIIDAVAAIAKAAVSAARRSRWRGCAATLR